MSIEGCNEQSIFLAHRITYEFFCNRLFSDNLRRLKNSSDRWILGLPIGLAMRFQVESLVQILMILNWKWLRTKGVNLTYLSFWNVTFSSAQLLSFRPFWWLDFFIEHLWSDIILNCVIVWGSHWPTPFFGPLFIISFRCLAATMRIGA
jgi:phage shock protein PspC (stress-responsive transcriptional regulator)